MSTPKKSDNTDLPEAYRSLSYVWSEPERSIRPSQELIPSAPDKAQLLRWQLIETNQAYQKDPHSAKPIWQCPLCWEPLLMSGMPHGGGYYIRHRPNPDYECPLKNGGSLSQDQWNALRFNGQKESTRHIELKQQIYSMLESWLGKEAVQMEPTVRGLDKLSWRRPDLLARIEHQQVAIEVQLSSTYIDVIVGREHFYRENGTCVLWLFDRFSDAGHRLFEKDIYYHHNGNAFEITPEALEAFQSTGVPHLTCHFLVPRLDGAALKTSWETALVPVTEITFCPTTFRTYWYDHDARKAALEHQAALSVLLEPARELISSNREFSARRAELNGLVDDLWRLSGHKGPAPQLDVGAMRMMEVIVSAQQSRFVGELGHSQNANWAFWANTIFEHYGGYAKAFLRVMNHYSLSTHFISRPAWQKKKRAIAERRQRGELPERLDWWPIFELLAPECNWRY